MILKAGSAPGQATPESFSFRVQTFHFRRAPGQICPMVYDQRDAFAPSMAQWACLVLGELLRQKVNGVRRARAAAPAHDVVDAATSEPECGEAPGPSMVGNYASWSRR